MLDWTLSKWPPVEFSNFYIKKSIDFENSTKSRKRNGKLKKVTELAVKTTLEENFGFKIEFNSVFQPLVWLNETKNSPMQRIGFKFVI